MQYASASPTRAKMLNHFLNREKVRFISSYVPYRGSADGLQGLVNMSEGSARRAVIFILLRYVVSISGYEVCDVRQVYLLEAICAHVS